MGRKSLAKVRKQEILHVFRQLIKEEGFEGASMTKVAKRMEVNSSLLFHYFSTKDEVVLALIEQLLEQYEQHFQPVFSAIQDAEKRMMTVLNSLFSAEWDDLAEGSVFYSSYPLIFRNPEIKRKFQAVYQRFHQNLMHELSLAQEAGVIHSKDISTSAHFMISMVEGINFYENILEDKVIVERQYALLKQLVMKHLGMDSVSSPS